MPSTERTIVTSIQTLLKGIDGTGSYTFDLQDVAGTERVIVGNAYPPALVPSCYIYPLSTQTAVTPGRTQLNQYDRTASIQVLGWVDATNADPGELVLRALDLQNDIMLALEADPCLALGSPPGPADDLEVSASTYTGAELDVGADVGLVVALVTVSYRETRAA